MKRIVALFLALLFCVLCLGCEPREDVKTTFLKELFTSDYESRFTAYQSVSAVDTDSLNKANEAYYGSFRRLTSDEMYLWLVSNSWPLFLDMLHSSTGVSISPEEPEFGEITQTADNSEITAFSLPLTFTKDGTESTFTVTGRIVTAKADGKTVVTAFQADNMTDLIAQVRG